MSSASAYWSQRRARDTERKALAVSTEARLWSARVARNAVASVLPGCPIPAALASFPVVIHQANGSRLVCSHLV